MNGISYEQMATFFAAIEQVAAASRAQRLVFHNWEGQPIGSLILDSGMIRFGVQVMGRPYLDLAFSRDAMAHAQSLIKILQGDSLSPTEAQLLTKMPLRTRRALRALTARALRLLASLCDPGQRPSVQIDPGGEGRRSPSRIGFTLIELMLTAASSGDIRYEDPAAAEYEMPPGNPKERWLFEWHGEEPRSPWPVQTTRLAERKVAALVEMARLGQRLAMPLQPLKATEDARGRTAGIVAGPDIVHYLIQTDRYLALLLYPPDQYERLIGSFETEVERRKGLGREGLLQLPRDVGELPGEPLRLPSAVSPTARDGSQLATDSVSAAWLELQAAVSESASEPTAVPHKNQPAAAQSAVGSSRSSPPPGDELPGNPFGRQSAPDTRREAPLEEEMALTSTTIKEVLAKLESGIDGFIGAAIADSDSGMCLGATGGGGVLNLEVAAASNTEVVRAKRKAIKTLGLRDEIDDILITLGKHYHLIRPLRSRPGVFIYVALDRARANLALARFTLNESERDITA